MKLSGGNLCKSAPAEIRGTTVSLGLHIALVCVCVVALADVCLLPPCDLVPSTNPIWVVCYSLGWSEVDASWTRRPFLPGGARDAMRRADVGYAQITA